MICSSANWWTISVIARCSSVISVFWSAATAILSLGSGVAVSGCEENTGVNFTREILDGAPADDRALVELSREGSRREWRFGELSERAARLAGTFARHGAGRGEVVMTLIGNRPE